MLVDHPRYVRRRPCLSPEWSPSLPAVTTARPRICKPMSSSTTPTACTRSYEASLASATELDEAIDAFVADPTDADPRGGEGRLARRPRRLRTDRGVPLLRRPDRRRGDGPGGSDQRLAARRGLHRLRRGRRDRRHHQRPGRLPDDRRELLTSLNEQGGEANISTGWHAIEFLLWGQDLSDDGPGRAAGHRLHDERRTPIGGRST